MLLQFIINGLITGLLYSLLAVGFALVYNTTHIFHIATAGIYVFAAYMFWWLAMKLGVPVTAALASAVLLTMALSLSTELCIYRPMRKKRPSLNVIMIASIGLMVVIVNLIAMLFGNGTKVVSGTVLKAFHLGNVIVTVPQLCQVLAATCTLAVFFAMLKRTRFGLKVRAISSDETLFETLGYDRQRTYSMVFLASGLFIGLASCLSAYDAGLDPNMGMSALINAMVAMIIGGAGRFRSCLIGGLVLGLIQSLAVLWFSAAWQNAVTFAMLLAFLFLRPQGLAGDKQRVV